MTPEPITVIIAIKLSLQKLLKISIIHRSKKAKENILMHMADALLSPAVGLTMSAVSVAAIGYAVAKVKKDEFSEKKVPIMGVAGAMVFAAQMIDFTIPATGSSGHIGGGILLAGLLGGIPAFLSIAAVIIIQCLFFADGGLLALGSNIFNLGVIPCLVIYPLIFRPILTKGVSYKRITIASILAVVIGLQLGAFGVVVMTTMSGITALPFATFTAVMQPIHLVIGILEGMITAAVLCFIYKMRPEIIETASTGENLGDISTKKVIIILAAAAILLGGGVALFASENPDGLEWSIERTTERTLGVETEIEAEGGIYDITANIQETTAFLPDYELANDPENALGTSLSGIIGAAITFGLAAITGLAISLIKKRNKKEVINA